MLRTPLSPYGQLNSRSYIRESVQTGSGTDPSASKVSIGGSFLLGEAIGA